MLKKKIIICFGVIIILCILFGIFWYVKGSTPEEINREEENNMLEIVELQVNNHTLQVQLEQNSSAQAFVEKLKENAVIVQASDYGNFEKVGELGFRLPTNDENITTVAGDLILYQGDKITLYYDSNTWSFTKLGKVIGISEDELRAILGDGDVTLVFSLSK